MCNASSLEECASGRVTEKHGALGIHLAAKGAVSDNRDLGQIGFRGHASSRIDQMMSGDAPAPACRPAGADRTICQRDSGLITKPDVPAITAGSDATHPNITTKVADCIVTELINEHVGEGALGDAAQV
jgi:hypothetical protein